MKTDFEQLYGSDPRHAERFNRLIAGFGEHFGMKDLRFFSSPARAEIGGNHTDHQHGRVLAAAIDIDTIAAAAENGTDMVRVLSKGYDEIQIDLGRLMPDDKEKGTSAAFVRGVIDALVLKGYTVRGFDAYIESDVPAGSSISSSAAFAVLFGQIVSSLFNDDAIGYDEIAIAAKYAENNHFGKPSGLLDQMTCASGGFVFIDFRDEENPVVERIDTSLGERGYSLCILRTGGNHANLTGEYASIPAEMKQIARVFGKEYLREVSEEAFYNEIKDIRAIAGDRAVMRAMHYFREDSRAVSEKNLLKSGDFLRFLALVRESGDSSEMLLQNVYAAYSPDRSLAFGIRYARHLLMGRGACRVQGGGFAGTAEAFVPNDMVRDFTRQYEAVFGPGTVIKADIRKVGCTEVIL